MTSWIFSDLRALGVAIVVVVSAIACAGVTTAPPRSQLAAPGESTARPRDDSRSTTPLERARLAWARGEVSSTAAEAWRARHTPSDVPELRALGARAALAIDCADQAIDLVGDSRDPELLRVAVRAHLTRDRWDEAAAIAAMPALASDEEARSIVEVARAAQGRPLWQVSGAPCAEVPLRSDASVPVVAVMIDRAPALALVDTTKHVTELSRRRVSASGVLDRLQIGDVSVEGVPYFARALDEEQALASDVIDVVLGRDVLFRWRVQFRHGVLMRLGGPLDIGPGDSAELVVIGDTPTVALHQVVRRHVPRAMQATHHSVGWLAVDSTRTTAIAIAEGLLGELPAGYDRVSESDRAMAHIPGLEVGGVSPRGPYPILADYESSEGRVRGAVGWPFLGYCAQLGWRLFVQGCFGGPRAPHACNERLASGPRTHGECDLDHLR